MAADADGKLLSMDSEWTVDHGAYAEGDFVMTRGAQFIAAWHHIPNIRGQGRVVYTNNYWGTAFRGFGAPQSEFASEVLMDELAEKIGMDPLELRYKNVYLQGSTTPTGCSPDVIALPGLIDILRPHYRAARERASKKTTDSKKRGVGIAVSAHKCGMGGPDSSEALSGIDASGCQRHEKAFPFSNNFHCG